MIRTVLVAAVLLAAAPAFAESAKAPAPAMTGAPSAKLAGEAQRLDLNSASVEQLSSVKGFNRTIAEAIVKARPFKNVEDLTARKIVSGEVLGPVKDQLTAR